MALRSRHVPAVLLALALMAGCTFGTTPAAAPSDSTAPQPSASASASGTPSSDKTATSVSAASCFRGKKKGTLLHAAHLDVVNGKLTLTITTKAMPWLGRSFDLSLDVASPNRWYQYSVGLIFAQSRLKHVRLTNTRTDERMKVGHDVSIEARTLTVRVPLRKLEGISADHFLWNLSLDDGSSREYCPTDPDLAPYASFPKGAPTTASAAEMAVGPSVVRVDGSTGFVSPSGNLRCSIAKDGAWCEILQYDWEMPREPAGGCGHVDWAATMGVTRHEVVLGMCRSDEVGGGLVLPYGHSYVAGHFECTSKTDGVHCRNRKKDMGFWLSRTHDDVIGYRSDPNKGFTFPKGPFTFSNPDGSVICHMDKTAGVDCTLEQFKWNKREQSAKCPNDGERSARFTVADGKAQRVLCVSMPTDPGTKMDDGTSVILGDYRCDINYEVACRNEKTHEGFSADEWNGY